MRKVTLVLLVSLLSVLTTACAGPSATSRTMLATPVEQADDVVASPGGLAYRANVHPEGMAGSWTLVQTSTMNLGTPPDLVQITYRDEIETKAGETRHNIFTIVAANAVSGNAAPPLVAISAFMVPELMTVLVTDNWSGPSGWSEIAFSITVSPDAKPGVYAIAYEAKIDGRVPYLLPSTITVAK